MRNNWADEIRNVLTMSDVIAKYIDVNPIRNRIPCPLHQGKNYNFGFNETAYHCFVCRKSGDIFTFVGELFHLNFPQTITKLNYDFSLGLPIGKRLTLRDREKLRLAAQNKKEKQNADLETDKALLDEYFDLLAKLIEYENSAFKHRPMTAHDEVDDRYVEAVKNIELYKSKIEQNEIERWKRSHDRNGNNKRNNCT